MSRNKLSQVQVNPQWKFKEKFPTISVYLTTWNCKRGNYPFELAIKSAKSFDEIVVVDGGSDDGTIDAIKELQKEIPHLKLFEIPINLENPGKDGELKAMARAMCMSEFLVQLDSDEIICGDSIQWYKAAKNMVEDCLMLNFFVAEPFGSINCLRLNKEHNPLKWRLSRSDVTITHGIPAGDRVEKNGLIYSSGKSDGCFPVHIINQQMIPAHTKQSLIKITQLKNPETKNEYREEVLKELNSGNPFVLHLGHTNLKNKIQLYLNSWHKWWCHLYDKDINDPQNNLYFPGIKIEDVTNEMVEQKIQELIATTPVVEMPELEQFLNCGKNE